MIAREIEKEGMPVVVISAMAAMAKQTGANRVVTGTKLIHPCGDPNLSPDADFQLRQEIVKTALSALKTNVEGPTVFVSNISFTPE